MKGRLNGKVALVTAAAQGIGRATAELFAAEGAQVFATDINVEPLADADGLIVRQLDVRDAQAIEALLAESGPLDVLFNCAGFVANGAILECTEADLAFSLDLNVTAMATMVKAALPAMIDNGGGSIINMASVAGSVKAVPNRFAYSVSKAAVVGLSKSVAMDYVTRGIRCNAICPGTVDTPSLHDRLRATGDYEAAWAAFTARQPMGRIGRPEEIAALALYLASDDAAFTTGQVHVIDGGWAN
ncbi:SDR family oxidoreductase [Sphingobium algorifonticola]|uniref:SDR family oxidoreductase n=1 Tax=Sphingobium algorifonticola TaxID=2008318 RepID=A0A437JCH7_9SPHN|nr:SDR family oxidoreductase [Sphingobium algorifonticola]RVT43453.1 SDR family oxidoreductase [Sphingobium algorifonticola]